jgi:hypothetical protein
MAFEIDGFGTKYYGHRWMPDGSYVTTEWAVFVYVPLVPLGSYHITDAEADQPMIIHPVPLDKELVWRVYGSGALVIALTLAIKWIAERFFI